METKERLVRLLRSEINVLRAWADESVKGGWSTHQVKPMRERADYLERRISDEEAKS